MNGDVPTEYDLRITNMQVTNTWVFTEKDMPGYSSKMNTGGVKEGDPAIPARFLYQDRNKESGGGGGGGGAKGQWGKPQRYQPYIRKAIPSEIPSCCWLSLLLIRTRADGISRHGQTRVQHESRSERTVQSLPGE